MNPVESGMRQKMAYLMTQPRAKAGGEYGPNGEWYEGGKFIATSENTTKSAPRRSNLTDAQIAEIAARKAKQEAEMAVFQEWKAGRIAKFKAIIDSFLECPSGLNKEEWDRSLVLGHGTFYQSLAMELKNCGYLSPKQAHYLCKGYFGRQTKKNLEEWNELEYALCEKPE